MSRSWAAGVWEQGAGLVVWSRHSSEVLARRAAVRYARRQHQPTGGMLSWCGGVRGPGGPDITWYRADGTEVQS